MKLDDIFTSIRQQSEDQQIETVTRRPAEIQKLDDPSPAVQIAAVKSKPAVALLLKKPTQEVIDHTLINKEVIRDFPNGYERFIRKVYPGNELMQRKWIRYADKIRQEIFSQK